MQRFTNEKKTNHMAQFKTESGIASMAGKFSKKTRLTMRQKTWHYPDGRVFSRGPKEMYEQSKRDYRLKPLTEAEEVQRRRWTAVCREASKLLNDPSHPRYAEMVSRHRTQLMSEKDAVLNKRICQFGNFVRAVLMREWVDTMGGEKD